MSKSLNEIISEIDSKVNFVSEDVIKQAEQINYEDEGEITNFANSLLKQAALIESKNEPTFTHSEPELNPIEKIAEWVMMTNLIFKKASE